MIRLPAALLACALLMMLPAAARAGEICVTPATECPAANTRDTVSSALALAAERAGMDTVRLGAATYPLAVANQAANSEVAIVGAGADATTLTGTDDSQAFNLYLNVAGSSIRDLTLEMGGQTDYGLVLTYGTAENVVVRGDDARPKPDRAIFLFGGTNTLRDVTVTLPTGPERNDFAVEAIGGTHTIEDSRLTGDNAVVVQADAAMAVRRSILTGHRTLIVHYSGIADIFDSVIRAVEGAAPDPRALEARAAGSSFSSITATRTTVRGNGTGVGVRSQYEGGCGSGSAKVSLLGSTVSNFPVSSQQPDSAENCAPGSFQLNCDVPTAGSQEVQFTKSHVDGEISVHDSCAGWEASVFGDPGFVSETDLRPRWPSPLIDRGDDSEGAGDEEDLAGAKRLVDGDGAGGARRDIGAYEYQRSAPTVTASVDPSSGSLTTDFGFSAVAGDPDGEPVGLLWTFSDGATAPGAAATKRFATAGDHSGTVVATDPAGLTATSAAPVTVAGPVTPPPAPTPTPSPTPSPTPAPVRDTTAPKVTVKGGTLKVSKKRRAKVTITCPATETAPCRIKLAASAKGFRSLGKGSGSVPASSSAKVTLTLTKKAYRHLERKKRLKAKLAVTATDAAGNSARISTRVTLKR